MTDAEHARLRMAALVYAAGLALHTADHLRRGLDAVTLHVLWAGNVSTLIGIAAVALILTRHRTAPVAAVAFGFPVALGVAAVHLLPQWSTALSDSFPDATTDVSWMSWTVVTIEIVGALATGLAGAAILRRTGLSTASKPPAPA